MCYGNVQQEKYLSFPGVFGEEEDWANYEKRVARWCRQKIPPPAENAATESEFLTGTWSRLDAATSVGVVAQFSEDKAKYIVVVVSRRNFAVQRSVAVGRDNHGFSITPRFVFRKYFCMMSAPFPLPPRRAFCPIASIRCCEDAYSSGPWLAASTAKRIWVSDSCVFAHGHSWIAIRSLLWGRKS